MIETDGGEDITFQAHPSLEMDKPSDNEGVLTLITDQVSPPPRSYSHSVHSVDPFLLRPPRVEVHRGVLGLVVAEECKTGPVE